jgi:ephrin-B
MRNCPKEIIKIELDFKIFLCSFHPATSSSEDLHRRIGGRCTTHNTKVIFKIFGGDDSSRANSNDKSSSDVHGSKSHDDDDSTNNETDERNTIDFNHPSLHPFLVNSNNKDNVNSNNNKATKKTSEKPHIQVDHYNSLLFILISDELDSHQNEVVKNEELTYVNATSRLINTPSAVLCCLIITFLRCLWNQL